MSIIRHCNTIFDLQTGDGFRTLALPRLITSDSLVVAPRMMIESCYKKHNAVTIHSVKKFIEEKKHDKIKIIVIDAMLPRVESQAHKALMKLCKGKQIAIIQTPHDKRALISMMELLSVTKNPKLKSIVFSRYLFNRGRW